MSRAVFLDRDGVLNRAIVRDGRPFPPSGFAELEILRGVPEACATLRAAGLLLIAVTNQPDVARGLQSESVVDAMNDHIRTELGLDWVYTCYHDNNDNCACRKPKPGLLTDAAADWNIDLSGSFMVGDRWRDIEAGRAAGCRTVLLDYSYTETLRNSADFVVASLIEAVPFLLGPGKLVGR